MAERTTFDKSTGMAQDVDWSERGPDELVPLTEEEREAKVAEIRDAMARLRMKLLAKSNFADAMQWTLKVFSWTIIAGDDDETPAAFACTFGGITAYVIAQRKEREAAAVIAEEEEA